ncbi:diguanylate cyclase [Oryzisolibacter sp. LB2S]|uniref:GGDEF domain-containing response regulator n=1 Tax=Alicycliphilus soli TaxID=3228789 RepID=UPI00345AF04D
MNPQDSPPTLLIVDDDRQSRLLLTELFEGEYRIIAAKNGLQALERARAHMPDLILLDVLMPEMDGMAVIHALKREDSTRHIPVIFITALDSTADEEQGLDLGAVDYITKPFHPSIARVRVRNHLQIVHQRRLLEQIAALDGLTGIPNRRRFDEALTQEWSRCQRLGVPLSLIIADVDQFKPYNDRLGHAAGDRVLQEIAVALRQGARRPGDLAARYGGEEFVLLLPATDASQAQQLAGELLQRLNARGLAHPASSAGPCVTLSLGGATAIPGSNEVNPEFFRRADAALYQAKAQGGDRWCWAP